MSGNPPDANGILQAVYDPDNKALRIDGTGSSGAPFSAHFITTQSEAGLSNETVFGTAVFYPPDVVANRPAASSTIPGAMFYGTDTGIVYRSDGSSVWTAVTTPLGRHVETLTDAATVTPNATVYNGGYLATLSQDTSVANPSGSPTEFQQYILRIKSASARALTWGTKYRGNATILLPSVTSGGGGTDYFGFQYNAIADKWDLLARALNF